MLYTKQILEEIKMIRDIYVYHIGNQFFYEYRGYSRKLKAKSLMEADREVRSIWKSSAPYKVFLVDSEPINRL